MTPADDFPNVVLYHGSFLVNLPSIQSHGIVPRAVDANAVVEIAIAEISEAFGLTREEVRELRSGLLVRHAIERIKESGFSKVYLSGEYDYAVSNAKAGGEWYEGILDTASRIKNQRYWDRKHELDVEIRDLEKQMKKNDAEMRSRLDRSDEDFLRSRELDRRHAELSRQAEAELGGLRRKIEEEKNRILSRRYGDAAVIFRVVMPYGDFVARVASSSRDRLSLFEQAYAEYVAGETRRNWFAYIRGDPKRVWEWFREVHMTRVEPSFIKGWDIL